MGASLWTLVIAFVVEAAVVIWCTLTPLSGHWGQAQTFHGFLQLYSVYFSNLDVGLLSVAKSIIVGWCALSAPATRPVRYGPTDGGGHKRRRAAIGATTTVFEALLMAKAAIVAVNAPDSLLPSGSAEEGTFFVGIVYMYVPICVGLLCSLVQGLAARSLLEARQESYQAAEPAAGAAGSLQEPLLAGAAAAEDGAGDAGKRGQAPGGAPSSGKEGASSGNGAKEGAGKDGKGKSGEEDEEKKVKVNPQTLSKLLRMSFSEWPTITVAFTAGSIAALFQAVIPYYTGLVIDYASIEPDSSKFKSTLVRLVWVSLLCGVFTGTRGGLFTVAMCKLNVRLRKNLFAALLQMEVGFFDKTKTGDITSRLAADTSTVSDQVCLNINVLMRAGTQAAMVLFFMFAASWRLTVVTFILIPAVLLISKVYGRYFSRLAKKVQSELAEANSVANEVLSSMTTVKAHAAQDSAQASYAAKLDGLYAVQLREAAAYTLYACVNTFLPNAVSAVVLYYGGCLVLTGQMSPGSLVSFMLYQQSLSSAFQVMGDVFSSLTGAVGAADKVLELMHRNPEVGPGGSLVPTAFTGKVELRDVVFAYPTRPDIRVLNGLSLVVNPGEVVALVGSSGGGKSSIVKLVERFYLPQSGCVLLDGVDAGEYHPKWLRRQVALVSQEPVLYARSIRRNIIYGLEAEDGVATPPTQEEVEQAARQANAHDFITSFPEGYETNCGEKGVQMSGGQKQRIAIARALVRKPRVLLLDEATSALDADSEAVVQEALDRMMHARTTLVIAHRLSTVQNADRIVVIGKGAVQEVGTHDQLLELNGVYATLVRRQLQKTQSAANLGGGQASNPGDFFS